MTEQELHTEEEQIEEGFFGEMTKEDVLPGTVVYLLMS